MLPRRCPPLAGYLAIAVAGIACASRLPKLGDSGKPVDARSKCWVSFSECAPPFRIEEQADVRKLGTRTLVNVAARLDVPDKLARKAANRLRATAAEARQSELLEMEAAIDDTRAVLGRCACPDPFRSELDKQGIAELVKTRLPSREIRSPEFWAERVFSELGAINKLRRSSAAILAQSDAEEDEEGAAGSADPLRDLQRRLCVTVHGARAALPPELYKNVLEIVNRREVSEEGEGSAAVARSMIAQYEAVKTCGPEPSGKPAPTP